MSWATILGWGRTAFSWFSMTKLLLIAGGIAAAIIVVLYLRNGQLAAERDLARKQADDAIAAIEAIQADRELARTIIAARDAKISELEGKTRDLISRIRAVPATKACASSPAMRVLLDGLRNEGSPQTR